MISKFLKWILRIVLVYLLAGAVYYLTGFLYNLAIGKPKVFSPFVGLPLTLLGWPMMIYADFIHRFELGIKPPLVVTALFILLTLIWLIKGVVHQVKSK